MMTICGVCEAVIEGEGIQCELCGDLFHVHCCQGICLGCSASVFPFNALESDDFITCLRESSRPTETSALLDNVVFNPLELNDIERETFLADIDPDTNFLNNLQINNITSQYFNENSLNKEIRVLDGKQHFSLFHLNIRSVPRNFCNLRSYIQNLNINFDVIGLTETWLNKANSNLYNMNGYVQRESCREGSRGGGVSLYIKEDLSFNVRNDLTVSNSEFESLFIELDNANNHGSKILVGVVYKPPSTQVDSFLDSFNDILNVVQNEHKETYIMGDFNIDLLRDKKHKSTSTFINTLLSYFFLPLINRPTRITSTSATLIDNIFCNNANDNSFVNGILYTDISDHLPVFCIKKNCQRNIEAKFITKRIFNEANTRKFHEQLNTVNWNDVVDTTDCQEAYSKFHDYFCRCYEEAFPLVKIKIGYKTRKSWLTSALKESIKTKNKLYMLQLKKPSLDNINIYKKYKRNLQKLLRQAERNHYSELLNNNIGNIRKSWEVINEVINKKKKSTVITNKLLVNGRELKDPERIANAFNDYFVNIGVKLSASLPPCYRNYISYLSAPNINSVFLQPTNNNEVANVIKMLKRKSPGHDGITADIIKLSYPVFIPALTHVINQSIMQGVFPQELKIAKVIPLFKGGDSTVMNNYRPVSILSVFSKIFEHIMYKRLNEFIISCNLLYKYQFGFREGHGTDLALITLVDKISEALDSGDYVLGVFLDLSKAFDTVNHEILLGKLQHYGIRGAAHAWIKSYLSNRNQYVLFNNTLSNSLQIMCGVPQGSILGPLLFLLYINDIVNISTSLLPILFADDTNLFLRGSNVDDLFATVNCEMKKLLEWVNVNKLSLNITKTQYMIFKNKGRTVKSNHNVYINQNKLKNVESTKFLGVVIDDRLSWLHHTTYIKSKIAKSIGILCKARKFLSQTSLITLYNSFIYPYLTYGVEVWGSTHDCYIQQIVKLQKRSVRIITSSKPREHTEPLFKSLKILPFSKIYLYCVTKLMFKYVKQLVPRTLLSMFSTSEETHTYPTRQRSNLRIPQGRTTMVHHTFRYMGVRVWNDMSAEVDHHCSLTVYKCRIKKYLFEV